MWGFSSFATAVGYKIKSLQFLSSPWETSKYQMVNEDGGWWAVGVGEGVWQVGVGQRTLSFPCGAFSKISLVNLGAPGDL